MGCLIPKTKKRSNKKNKNSGAAMMAGNPRLSLAPFKELQWPAVFPTKLRYTDYRAVVAAGNQLVYVYRLNSVFDPDFTGAGGQPSGFDQLAALYGRYRVIAVDVSVKATEATSGNQALVVMAASDNSALSVNAETLTEQRFSRADVCQFEGKAARLRALWRIGELLGYSDESMLANSNVEAAITANPSFQQFLFVQAETSGATDTVELDVELTYYVRFEVPITQAASVPRRRFASAVSTDSSRAACGGAKSTTPQLASTALTQVRRLLDELDRSGVPAPVSVDKSS